MALDYAWEKLHIGVEILAVGDGSLRERLEEAYTLSITNLEADDFPTKASQKRFEALVAAIEGDVDDRSVADTLATLSDDKCVELAKEIVSLADGVSQSYALSEKASLLQ